MLKEKLVKDYFRQDGTVFKWWDPEQSDMVHVYARETKRILDWLREEKEIKDILDVSCGRGRILQKISSSYRVTGLDISDEMLRFVQSNISHVNLIEGDAENLPFQSGSFDCIVCLKSLVHYPNPQRALAEFNRVLRGAGILIADIDNALSLKRIIKTVNHSLNKIVDKNFRPVSEGIYRPFNIRQFVDMLNLAGFKIEEKVYEGVIVPIAFSLPGGRRTQIITGKLSQQLESLDRVFEKTPGIEKLATYLLVKCSKSKD